MSVFVTVDFQELTLFLCRSLSICFKIESLKIFVFGIGLVKRECKTSTLNIYASRIWKNRFETDTFITCFFLVSTFCTLSSRSDWIKIWSVESITIMSNHKKSIANLHLHIYTSLCRSIISILKKFKEHPLFTGIQVYANFFKQMGNRGTLARTCLFPICQFYNFFIWVFYFYRVSVFNAEKIGCTTLFSILFPWEWKNNFVVLINLVKRVNISANECRKWFSIDRIN